MPTDGKDRPPEKPSKGARLVVIALFVMFVVTVLVQVLLRRDPPDAIRYDELVRFVSEDRVQWMSISAEELAGEYRSDRKPAPRPGRSSRSDRFVTGRVVDDTLVPLLQQHHVAFRANPSSGWTHYWPWIVYIVLSLLMMTVVGSGFAKKMGGPASFFALGKSKGKVFQENDVQVRFADVAGVREAKEELEEILEFLRSPEKFKRLGAKIPKGVLLVGPPGTGKTLLARAVAGEAGVPFISISGSEFVEMFVGVGAARVRDLFEQAAKAAPCIVFVDEIDALGRSRSSGPSGMGTNEEREQTLNQLLVEMDGFEPNASVILIAATNRPEILDSALLRPGRFDRQILVDRPDKKGREEILAVHLRNVPLHKDVNVVMIAERTPGFAGAELANLVNEAALIAARRGRDAVELDDFSAAIDRVVAGLEKKSRLIGEREKKRVAFHEVGHALANVLAGGDDKIHKISIVPRGMAALGYTITLPTEERYLMTRTEIQAKLVGILGGRAAEEVIFGEPSTGAQNDLQKATDVARAIVTEYGLSDALGPVSLSTSGRSPFLAGPGGASVPREFGSGVADAIDAEIRRIVEAALQRAVELLRDNRPSLETISERLLAAEQLEGEELEGLLAKALDSHRQRVTSSVA